MSGISSKAAGILENKNEKFQGQKFDEDLGLNWYGFKWRNHDPQIGRFIQIDPLADKYPHNSTYAFSENRVINARELEGLEAVDVYKTTFEGDPNEYWDIGYRDHRDALPQFGTTGTLWHFLHVANDDSYVQSLIYEAEPVKSGGLPQFQIFGNGDGSFSSGSPVDLGRPLVSVNLGSGGDANELFSLIMLFTKIPTSNGMTKDIGGYLTEKLPGLVSKRADAYRSFFPNQYDVRDPWGTPGSEKKSTTPYVRVDGRGNVIDTVFPPWTHPSNDPNDIGWWPNDTVIPNRNYIPPIEYPGSIGPYKPSNNYEDHNKY